MEPVFATSPEPRRGAPPRTFAERELESRGKSSFSRPSFGNTSLSHGSARLPARLLAIIAALLAALSLLATAVPAGAQAASPETDAAIAWMDAELDANGGTLPGWLEGTVDWGLMGDFALARIATGHADDTATRELAQRLLDNLGTYSTWDNQGDKPGVRSSGALAKVYLVALGAGLDTTDVDGVDLEAEMRSLMNTTGDQVGRFSDRNPYGPDYSLALGQSWAMMALAHTSDGVPAEALSFLAAQQCPAGGFRLVYEGTPGCGDDSEADPDSTALAIAVLLGVERSSELESVLSDAIGWLVDRQEPDGSFGGGTYTEAPNANSTGVIAQALRAAGLTEEADAASAWIIDELQLGAEAAGTAAEAEVGAIAYDPASHAAAIETGIAEQGRDQWRRATAQGVLALGAGLLVDVVDPPGTPTSTTTTSTTTTSTTTSSTTTTTPVNTDPPPAAGTPTDAGAGAPGSTGVPSAAVAGQLSTNGSPTGASGSASGTANSSAATTSLARTGSDGASLAIAALTLMSLGAVALGVGARSARRNGASVAR